MTATPQAADHGCADPHDHTGHDHPPTGADVVRDLVRGLSVLALVLPALGLVLLLAILPLAPPASWCWRSVSCSVPRSCWCWWPPACSWPAPSRAWR
ncbi:hypothetical protein [Brachybacterium epidermidis]|uniref:hypothetical protein n=1 Tax=Brachybacterium epidermidis TaxID=2781983 RepID=UPI001D147435|nr:hypothetical protein [Brachybacterium epidermidis]